MRQVILLLIIGVSVEAWATEKAGLLVYRVWESGLDPYISRVLVSAQFVRLDEGLDPGDFTLFHRQSGIIYNVSATDETVLLFRPPPKQSKTGQILELRHELETDDEAPLVAGKQPRHLKLYSNDKLCRELVTIEGVMTDTLSALAEFQKALARVQLATLGDENPTLCEQSELLYASDRSLKFGLPVRDSWLGKKQLLLDFNPRYKAAPELFSVPAWYREIVMPGLSAE